eukprot:Tamp_25729.p1 GENE.Tamp_25729~~Tamp_25729.p1  ORF type:complete len:215 (-),score=63.22 Tamp_25729:158-802(-)
MEAAKKWFAGLMAKEAGKQAEKEAAGWWEGFKQEIQEGKFNTYARVGGVINFVLIIFLSWTFFISLFPHSTLCLLVGIVVGFIELPFCCWCIPQCNQLAQFMSPLKIYWIRGCGYLFMALLLFAAYWGTGGGILMVIFSLMLTADGVCYVLAHFKGESETQESGYDTLERGQVAATAPAPAPAPAAPAEEPDLRNPEDFKSHRTNRSGLFPDAK